MEMVERKHWRSRLFAVLCKRKLTKLPPLYVNEPQRGLIGQEVKSRQPSLLDLPNEILLLIAEDFEDPLYIYRLVQTCHHLASLLTPLLHKHAVLDKAGIPALHWAAIKGHEGLVRLLLQKGADVNLLDPGHRGWTALHLAAKKHEPVVRVLLDAGADISIRDRFEETPLHRAVLGTKNQGIVRLLLEAGAGIHDQDFLGNTPLHRAVRNNSPDQVSAVQLLLDMGADVSVKNGYGETAVHEAVNQGSLGSLFLLLKKGDALNDVDIRGQTALHHAVVQRSDHFLFAMRSNSIGYKLNVNIQDENGATPLHIAAANENFRWIDVLLDKGADVSIKDNRGRTACDIDRELKEKRHAQIH